VCIFQVAVYATVYISSAHFYRFTNSWCCVAAKPIDLLARYISAEDDDLAVEMHEPYTYLNVRLLYLISKSYIFVMKLLLLLLLQYHHHYHYHPAITTSGFVVLAHFPEHF